ncbi:kunitz-type protease inhibitor 2 isoform X1 [Larimichthys crocea]|uniref:kunitz-type protease inhibitor 2 isoform X1 n=1 Tax=Larimichthys crocea TaxID=215358 RepID=UPI000900BB99|nr:kunitz-type serine protease inhibitor 6 isoform X1 [Larimichthys crocea]
MKQLRLLTVCFLVCSSLALECDWDQSTDQNQGLDPNSLVAGALHLDKNPEVSDAEGCRAACCKEPDCDLALVGLPADGGPQCLLVKCVIQDRDVCVLQPSEQFRIYRRKVHRAGETSHIVPLMNAVEPKTETSNETSNVLCRLPMKVGSCRAAFPKFFYNVTNQSCQKFTYGGCESNGNNFDTKEQCEAKCSGVTGSVLPDESTPAPPLPVKAARMAPAFNTKVSQDPEGPAESELAATESGLTKETGEETEMSADDFAERCGAEPEVGPCRAAFQHWYYNRETGSCQSFIYGGCRGNKNNYMTKESCMTTCTVTVLPSSKKTADDVSQEYKDQCTATPDPGPCRAAFPMYYYDPKANSCQSFMYGGCRGNQNRYDSMDKCLKHCTSDAVFDGHGRSRNRWTAAVFLFVTLAAVSALLLAALIVISLRRHGLSHHASSISDKEELLPDPDEQSSVESLTLPESPKPDQA